MVKKLKVLTVCAGAVCRSVAMALFLKGEGHDAVALSADWNSRETFELLSTWAYVIVLMEPQYLSMIPVEFHSKVKVCDVGPDVWRNPMNEELLEKCYDWVNGGGLSR